MSKASIFLRLASNYLNATSRPFPDFLIIGCQKGGTSSLFEYLVQHPQIDGSLIKEVQFFTSRHWIGERGYRSFFPPKNDSGCLATESTPYYLFSEVAPGRVAAMLPEAKLLVLLREPVGRAYSHYKHNCRRGHETRSFEEAVEADISIFEKQGSISKSPDETEQNYRHFSYVRRGLYDLQIARWLEYFPRENFFISRAEDFFKNPSDITQKAIRFLGLENVPLATDLAHNQYHYDHKSKDQFPELCEFFREPNQRILASTGITWD
jgi:hypothetical protein